MPDNKIMEVLENLRPHAPGQGPPVPQGLPGWPDPIKELLGWNWPGTPFPREQVASKIRTSKAPDWLKGMLFKLETLERGVAIATAKAYLPGGKFKL